MHLARSTMSKWLGREALCSRASSAILTQLGGSDNDSVASSPDTDLAKIPAKVWYIVIL